jgi:DNA-binding Xre family transcriptional regulator
VRDTNVLEFPVASEPMYGRKPKSDKTPSVKMRQVLAENLRARMLERYPKTRDRIMALAEAAGISRSTVQRITAEEPPIGASIDTIDAVAKALRVRPADLLMPRGTRGRAR